MRNKNSLKPETVTALLEHLVALLMVAAVYLLLPACSSFRAETTKKYIDPKTSIPVEEHTLSKARSFFDSKGSLTKLKNAITPTTSGTTVGELNQETSGSNAVQVVKVLVETVAPPVKAIVP